MTIIQNIRVLPPSDNYSPFWAEYYKLFPQMHRSVGAEGDGEGGEGGDNNGGQISSEELEAAINKKATELADSQTSSLKAKNEELLTKMAEMKKKLEPLKDYDADSLAGLMNTLEKSDEAKMIAEGKIDELIAKRTDKVLAEANEKVDTLQKQLDESQKTGSTYENLYKTKMVSDQLMAAAIKHGVSPAAYDDVNMRGSGIFTLGEDGKAEARTDKGDLVMVTVGESEVILTPDRFVESLKKTHSHYFGDSSGGGLGGSTRQGHEQDLGATLNAMASSENFDLAAYKAAKAKQK